MKARIDERILNPETMTTYEYIYDQLYRTVLKGGYNKEFSQLKEVMPALSGFSTAAEFMHAVRKNRKLRAGIVRALEQLWRADYKLRPASGTVLVLALWTNAGAASSDFWFRYFTTLAKGGTKNVE